LASLTRLAENVSPSELLPQTGSTSATSGLAHDLTKRFIPVSSPVIRGTLDPRRPHGLHDNLTVRLRSPTSQSLGGSSAALASPHAPPPRIGPHGYMAPPTLPQQLSVPPPHVLPTSSSSRYQSQPRPSSTAQTPQRSAQPYDSAHSSSNTQSRPQFGAAYAPYTPNSTGNAVYGRTTTNSASTPARLGPGPSSLRQSFGPTTPGSSYGTSAPVRAPTINPMAQQMRSTGTPSRL